jgi:hypothetical protein
MTLLPAELRIVHRRMVHASVSALRADSAVIPSEARNLTFGGLRHRRWGFFGAFAPQNDSFLYIFQITHINARSAESTLEQCVYERHEKAMLNGQGCRLASRLQGRQPLFSF